MMAQQMEEFQPVNQVAHPLAQAYNHLTQAIVHQSLTLKLKLSPPALIKLLLAPLMVPHQVQQIWIRVALLAIKTSNHMKALPLVPVPVNQDQQPIQKVQVVH